MSSLSRFFTLCICAFSLLGCGFHPLYAKKDESDNSKVYAGVKVDDVPGRQGQEMRIALEDGLNPDGDIPASPAYRLAVTFTESVVPIGVARDGTVSTYNIYLMSHYVLYRNSDSKAITSGDISYANSFNNAVNEYFSTYVSEQDAIKRNITELAELYRQRITSYLDEGAPEQEIKKADTINKAPVAYSPALFNQLPGMPINAQHP